MLALTIEISGKSTGDLEIALQEVLKHVEQGYFSGANSNDTGGYSFDVSGEEETLKEKLESVIKYMKREDVLIMLETHTGTICESDYDDMDVVELTKHVCDRILDENEDSVVEDIIEGVS